MKVHGTTLKEAAGRSGVVCAWGYEKEIDLSCAAKLGRVSFYGDRRTFLIAKTQEGELLQIIISKQPTENQKELKKMLDKMPLVRCQSSSAFSIKWKE